MEMTSSLGYINVVGEMPIYIKKGETFLLGGIRVFAESSSVSSLSIFRHVITCDAMEIYTQRTNDIINEIRRRKEDIVSITNDIDISITKAEAGDDDVGLDLVKMMALRGHHNRRIKELEHPKSYQFEERHERRSIQLQLGVMTSMEKLIPSLEKPIVWYLDVVQPELDIQQTKLVMEEGFGHPMVRFGTNWCDERNIKYHNRAPFNTYS